LNRLFAIAVLFAPVFGVAAELRAVELHADSAGTVISVALDAKPQLRSFLLEAPDRLVIDLQDTRRGSGFKLPTASGLVTALRQGPQPGGKLRLVFELEPRTRYAQLVLPADAAGRHRLVLTLTPRDRATTVARPAASAPNEPELTSTLTPATSASAAVPAASMPRPAEPSAPVRAAHAPAESGRDVLVAIDAGHGGQDPGALGRHGTREKDVVLAIAKELAAKINAEPGMRAVLTRDGDYFLSLRERMGRARKARADMFLSVHADSVRDSSVSGASVYVLSEKGATDEQARWLAERENAADLKGGVSLDDKDNVLASVLLDLSQSASIAESMRAAERVLRSLDTVTDVRKKTVLQAGFVVLKSPDIPSMLVETAYISNPGDEAELRRDAHRERIAGALFQGVRDYFTRHPPDGTRFAQARRNEPPTARN
jgi:N-acetylmuramoyl-L-alanine amidase